MAGCGLRSMPEMKGTVYWRLEATAILICGAQVDRNRVGAIAASAGIRVVELPAERPLFPRPERLPPKRRGPS